MSADGRTHIVPQTDLVVSLHERAALIAKATDPNVKIERAAATYKLAKRKRLTAASQRGYEAVLDDFTASHSGMLLSDFDSAQGVALVEQHLLERYGLLAPRTYNKALSVLTNFFGWYHDRATIGSNPAKTIEKAKARPIHRRTFSDSEVLAILTSNKAPRDQIALRLLLFFGIRKGALRGIRFEDFKPETRELTIFTKGEKIQTLQIVDDAIWELIADLGEPGGHYLLPKRVTRKRIPPERAALREIGDAFAAAETALRQAAKDEQASGELADVLDALRLAGTRLGIAVDTASTQTRLELAEPIGQHGCHLWWYRSLRRAGVVEEGVSAGRRMHWSRHTAIQRIVDKTGNISIAQNVSCHANTSTTEGYTRPSAQLQAETMRKVLA